jgi:putative copper export protein
MLEISLFIVLLVLGVRAFLALRHESKILKEFSQSAELDWLTLGCPLGPIVLLVGLRFLPQLVLLIVVAAYYAFVLITASRQRNTLERSGTDRTKLALAATVSASLCAIVGLIYVALASIFAFLGQAIQSPGLGV